MRRRIRSACARSSSTHHARSSNAAASNSKLLNGGLKRKTLLVILRTQEPALHRLRLQKVHCFPFGFYFAPESDWNDDRSWFTALIGNKLDLCVRHQFQFTFTRKRLGICRTASRRRGSGPLRSYQPKAKNLVRTIKFRWYEDDGRSRMPAKEGILYGYPMGAPFFFPLRCFNFWG